MQNNSTSTMLTLASTRDIKCLQWQLLREWPWLTVPKAARGSGAS